MTYPTWHGGTVCECIVTSGPHVEQRFVAAGLIRGSFAGLIAQWCYSTLVDASALTHAWGGVLDIIDWTPYRDDADILFTGEGWIAFYRPANSLYSGSPPHWHIVLNGCPHLHPQAAAQIAAATNGLNGLKGKGKDTGPRPFITWQQAVNLPTPAHITTDTEDDNMFVLSTNTGGLRLVTAEGSVDLGSPGNADAVLSALNARATRVMGTDGLWHITPSPYSCSTGEADKLASFLAIIRGSQTVTVNLDAATIAADLIAAGIADDVVTVIGNKLTGK